MFLLIKLYNLLLFRYLLWINEIRQSFCTKFYRTEFYFTASWRTVHSAIIIHRDSNMSIGIDQRSGVIRGCSTATNPADNFPPRRDIPAVSGNHAELRTAPRLVWKPWSMASGSGKETVWWGQITMIRAARGVSGSTCQRAWGDRPSSLNVWTDDWEYLMVEGTWLLHQDLAGGKISTTNYTSLRLAWVVHT